MSPTAATGAAGATAPGAARPVTPVGILAELIASVTRRLDDVAGVDDDVRLDLRRAGDLAGGLEAYVEACTTPASPTLAALQRRTVEHDWREHHDGVYLEQEMLSGHVEGAFLGFLVRLAGARRVLEIGMFTGYSALAIAEALPDGGRLTACELDPHVAALAEESFAASPAGSRIAIEVGPALETLGRLVAAGESFDLVFLDADKAGYAAYLDVLLDHGLLAPAGVVCVDNTLLQGEPWLSGEWEPSENGRAIAVFNARLVADPRVEQVLVPLRDGLTLVRRVDA